jgi:hypothetical protein
MEIELKRSSRAECEWTMKDWRAAVDEIKNRGCWGMKYRNGKGRDTLTGNRVCLGGVRIGCSKIHKSELAKEVKLQRSSQAECEWTMKDWRATMDQIKNRGCWGIRYRQPRRRGHRLYCMRLGGSGVWCSWKHKSDLAKELQLKRSSRAECEWTTQDWQAACDQIQRRGCWGTTYLGN